EVIAIDAGPSQGPAVSPVIVTSYKLAVVCRSAASASQAAAADSIDAEPGPAYIRAELNSGGSEAKSMKILHPQVNLVHSYLFHILFTSSARKLQGPTVSCGNCLAV